MLPAKVLLHTKETLVVDLHRPSTSPGPYLGCLSEALDNLIDLSSYQRS